MNPETKIKYTFHNNYGETAEMTFTMIQIEGAEGGFIKYVTEILDDMDFGLPTQIERLIL